MKPFLKGKLKGVFAFFATLFVAVSLAPTAAFAATAFPATGIGKVTGLEDNASVTLIKVAKTTVNEETNVVETQWIAPFTSLEFTPADYAQNAGKTQEYANNIAQIANNAKDTDLQKTDAVKAVNGSATFNGLETGLYFVTVDPEVADTVYQNTLLAINAGTDVNGNWTTASGEVELKKGTVTLEKKVSADGVNYDKSVDTLSAGDKAHYLITATVPHYNYTDGVIYSIVDTPANGVVLDSVENVTVELGNTVLTGVAKIENGELVVTLGKAQLDIVADNGSKLTIKYSGTVQHDKLGDLTNTATLTYTSKAGSSTTKNDSAHVTVYGVNVNKTGENKAKLANAEFKLQKQNGEEWVDVTNANGQVVTLVTTAQGTFDAPFKSLGKGTYQLVETKAPAGYVLPENAILVTVSSEAAGNDHVVVKDVANVKNPAGVLPTTGGPGTVAMTVAGVVVMAGAACFVVRSRKQN